MVSGSADLQKGHGLVEGPNAELIDIEPPILDRLRLQRARLKRRPLGGHDIAPPLSGKDLKLSPPVIARPSMASGPVDALDLCQSPQRSSLGHKWLG